MADEPFMDRWTLNGTEVLLQDHGRDQANGVPVLDNEAKLPVSYLPQNYASWLKVDPNDPNNDTFDVWLTKLNSNTFRNRCHSWARSSVMSTSFTVKDVIEFNNLYLVIGSSHSYWSLDGANYTEGTGFPANSLPVSWASNSSICVCGFSGKGIYYTEDGKSWTLCSDFPSTYSPRAISYLNGIWLCGSSSHGVWWSLDGKSWTQGTGVSTSSGDTYWTFNYYNGIYVCSNGIRGGIFWSENGKDWTTASGVDVYGAIGITIAVHNGKWVMGSSNNYAGTAPTRYGMFYSNDGKTWTTSQNIGHVFSVGFYNNIWLAVLTNSPSAPYNPGRMFWSEDGETWTESVNAQTGNLYSITYSDAMFMTNGTNSGPVKYSYDGKTWYDSDNALHGGKYILYANGIWILGCTDNFILYSELGTTNWTQASGSTSSSIAQLRFVKDKWFGFNDSSGVGLWISNSVNVWTPNIS